MADKKIIWPSWLQAKKTLRAGEATNSQTLEQREKDVKLDLEKDLKKIDDSKCLSKFLTISFTILTVVAALVAIALIAVSTMSAVAASAMDAQDDTGRLVGLIVLSFTAAVTVAVVIYSQIATCGTKIRPIFVAVLVLILLAVIQAIIAGASVRVSPKDANRIERSLSDSFQLARQHSPKHVKMWATTQFSLHCCGFTDPFDYRDNAIMPPDVPVSCCPTYDPARSDIMQERDRETCKARREYYQSGCSGEVLLVITETSLWVFHVSIALIVLEIAAAVFGALVVRNKKMHEKQNKDSKDDHDPEPHQK